MKKEFKPTKDQLAALKNLNTLEKKITEVTFQIEDLREERAKLLTSYDIELDIIGNKHNNPFLR